MQGEGPSGKGRGGGRGRECIVVQEAVVAKWVCMPSTWQQAGRQGWLWLVEHATGAASSCVCICTGDSARAGTSAKIDLLKWHGMRDLQGEETGGGVQGVRYHLQVGWAGGEGEGEAGSMLTLRWQRQSRSACMGGVGVSVPGRAARVGGVTMVD